LSRPADDGFYLPAEWAPHARCWMAWPVRGELWGDHLDAVREAYAEVANAIARFEPVTMVVKPKNVAEASLQCGPGISMYSLPHDDSWLRDNGPSFVVDHLGGVAGVSWKFNGWGGRFADYDRDAVVAEALLSHLEMRRYDASVIFEGGALVTDGEGTAIAAESILLNPNRNPGISKAEMEKVLASYLGIRKVIWLTQSLAGAHGESPVDDIAIFARPGVVLALACSDSADTNHGALADTVARLRSETDAAGRALDVITIEQPRARYMENGDRLNLSYVDCYIANGAVIMPVFEDPQDARAYEVFGKVFAGREIVQIPAADIAFGGGGLHAIALGQPAGPVVPAAA
jgi:agmatine deiminase